MCRILCEYYLIKKSGLFDKQYYLDNNPDVLKADMNPLWHFLRFGWKEGRNPSRDINLRKFLMNDCELSNIKIGDLYPLLGKLKPLPSQNKAVYQRNKNAPSIEPEIIINHLTELQKNYVRKSKIREKLIENIRYISDKPKVFCIGLNKTGTTSMAKALKNLGFIVGNQTLAELLLDDWAKRDFRSLINYCYTAQAFQDIPFSLPYSFQALDGYFPNSKFILTIRDNPEQWYNSLVYFQSKIIGKGEIPTISDRKKASYVYPGYLYKTFKWIYNTPEEDPYNKEMLVREYEFYNFLVQDYFKLRPKDLLVINLADAGSYQQLCEFLEKPCPGGKFPHENMTKDIDTIK